jgi:parvulin-like peptidyl-prolyl isomerase
MTKYRLLSVLAVALVGATLAAGCGKAKTTVGANDVAVVGDCTISKEQFDHLFDQARASYRAQKRELKPGTSDYIAVRKTAVQILSQRCQFEQKAKDLGMNITDKDVTKELQKVKAQYFGTKGVCDAACEKKYRTQLKRQGLTDEQVREDIRASTVQNRIYNKITKDVVVTDKDVDAYYVKNKANYIQPASREVRHILVKKKALADRLYQQIKNGANMAQLAKRYSDDTTTKAAGGKVTYSKGRQEPALDKVVFALATHELSKPVKGQFGWHIFEALTATTKEHQTPLNEVRPAIRQQLTQQTKQEAMKKWVDGVEKDFASKTTYQVGYTPPATTTSAAQP